jgi:hypothetical protein
MTPAHDLTAQAAHLLLQVRAAERAASPLQEKVLLLCILDAAARAKYPREKERERVVRLLESCAAWDDRFKVSLEQLRAHLEVMFSEEERRASRLYRHVLERLAALRGMTASPQSDPSFVELEPLALAEECQALGRAKYSSLLYAYRQEILAGFRMPESEDQERSSMPEPYYRPADGSFHLVFPLALMRRLVQSCIETLTA